MAEKLDHIVLIVDDEEQVGRAVGRIMKQLRVKYVYMDSGQAALDRIKTASSPFSLIISDQRMPGMTGAQFLEKAKEAAPDTLRFLLTGYADVDAVTAAVNKGSIHRYIAKPWNNKEFIETVKAGLEQYELIVENDRLFKLAKAQNTKLYTLNKELKKSTAVHHKAISQRDKEIANLKKKLEIGFENRNYINEIEVMLKEHDMLEQEQINTLYAAIVAELFEQFQDIATRNGFEMPTQIPGD
ncbi:MAG: response regulator [Desulfobacterales bacterium]|nr:response regulator [Desulfobacterales bacterium]